MTSDYGVLLLSFSFCVLISVLAATVMWRALAIVDHATKSAEGTIGDLMENIQRLVEAQVTPGTTLTQIHSAERVQLRQDELPPAPRSVPQDTYENVESVADLR